MKTTLNVLLVIGTALIVAMSAGAQMITAARQIQMTPMAAPLHSHRLGCVDMAFGEPPPQSTLRDIGHDH